MMEVKLLENGDLKLTGSGSTLLGLLEKIYNNSNLKIEVISDINEIIPRFDKSAISRFIKKHQCCMESDDTEYDLVIRKLN